MALLRKAIRQTANLAIKNIGRHPIKNILVGLVIILAGNIFLVTGSLADNSRKNWRHFFASTFLGDYNLTAYKGKQKDFTLPVLSLPDTFIPTQLYEELEKQGVAYTKRIKLGAVVYNEENGDFEGTPVTILGVDLAEEYKRLSNLQFTAGTINPELAEGVLVWAELADYYRWTVGKEITLFLEDIDGNTLPFDFTITGIISNKTGKALDGTGSIPLFPLVFVSYEYLNLLLGLEEDAATDLAVWDQTLQHETELKGLAKKHGLQFFYGEQGFEVIWGVIEFIYFIGIFIEVFILVVLVVSTFNLNMMGFFERKKELGTMYALGAKSGLIVSLFLMEMIIFTVVAFGCSVLLYLLISLVTARGLELGGGLGLAFAGAKVHLQLVPSVAFVAFLAIILAMIGSSIYPVYLTTKINPVEVFREAEI